MNNTDREYFRLANLVLEKGRVKKNRTGIDTIGTFGAQARFDLQEGFPLLTTKKVWFKGIAHELLWFLSGSTNIKYLVDNNVHIWDEWAYAKYKKESSPVFGYFTQEEFINKIKVYDQFAKQWGELGEGTYGGMWRNFPFWVENNDLLNDYNYPSLGGVDQIQKLIDKLKTNPDDRRLIVSAWHPYWVDHCALPPCHALFQFHTEELDYVERCEIFHKKNPNFSGHEFSEECLEIYNIPKRKLNCQLYQRSCDLFLGVPFNIASYALLTQMVAHCVNMAPGEFIHTYGDLHIYENHLPQIKEQMTREPLQLPTIELNAGVRNLFDFKYEDIKLVNYKSHPPIKGEVAV